VWSPSLATARRAAKRRAKFYSFINLWPFASIMVALLFVFLADLPPIHYNLWYAGDLPASVYARPQPLALREDSMRIYIRGDGSVFFGNTLVAPDELPGLVRSALQDGAEKKAYLAVDPRSRYAATAKTVEQLRLAGIQRICFLAEKPAER
jgi:biopolymer transport protein ExbD